MAKRRRKKPTKTRTGKETRGRPTKFNELIHAKIVELAEGGMTEYEIAERVGVSERTIQYWKQRHFDFLHSLKDAKDIADQMVEASLFQRACGYTHPAEKHFLGKGIDGESEVITHEYVEHYPPSEVAAIFWLKNRQPERWRDKPEAEKTPGNDDAEVVIEWDDEAAT